MDPKDALEVLNNFLKIEIFLESFIYVAAQPKYFLGCRRATPLEM